MDGSEGEKPFGRPPRPAPNTGAGPDWLAEPFADPIPETARRFASNLKAAIQARYEAMSPREVAAALGVDHNSLRKVLAGNSYPDLVFIVKVETGLNKTLWPGRIR
jgi:hypothetical protein